MALNNRIAASARLCRLARESELLLLDGTICDSYIGNDGKGYRTIKIGNRVWIAENLAESKFRTGEFIPEITDDELWSTNSDSAMCAYNNNINNV